MKHRTEYINQTVHSGKSNGSSPCDDCSFVSPCKLSREYARCRFSVIFLRKWLWYSQLRLLSFLNVGLKLFLNPSTILFFIQQYGFCKFELTLRTIKCSHFSYVKEQYCPKFKIQIREEFKQRTHTEGVRVSPYHTSRKW